MYICFNFGLIFSPKNVDYGTIALILLGMGLFWHQKSRVFLYLAAFEPHLHQRLNTN
jgi:hypothetical protein